MISRNYSDTSTYYHFEIRIPFICLPQHENELEHEHEYEHDHEYEHEHKHDQEYKAQR